MKRYLFPFILLVSLGYSASAQTLDEIIDRARAFVGPEEKIESIQSIVFEGRLVDERTSSERGIRLVVQKPNRQRLEITEKEGKISLVVNGREGFLIRESFATGRKEVITLPIDEVRRLTANARENLYFYRFPAEAQVRSKYMGRVQFRGEEVDAVRFLHSGTIEFMRYFDVESGELVGTVADEASVNIEEGIRIVDGLKFSNSVKSFIGEDLQNEIFFDAIEVNPTLPEDVFDYPNE